VNETEEGDPYARYQTVRVLNLKQRLQGEKDTLGLYVTGHPIDDYDPELSQFMRTRLDNVYAKREDQWLAGMVVASRTMKTKRGKTIAFLTLDDRRARIEVALFGDSFEKYRDIIHNDRLLIVKGEVSEDDYSGGLKVSAKEVLTMPQARTVFSQGLQLMVHREHLQGHNWQRLQELLRARQVAGDAPATRLALRVSNDIGCGLVRCASPWRLSVDDDLLQELRYLLGENAVRMNYRRIG
jgi:DNA polymerase-3 subunit alpha